MPRYLVALSLGVVLAGGCRLERLEPATAGVARATASGLLAVLPDSLIPAGALGLSIRRGRALLAHTGDSLPQYVGNALTCTSCHLDDGLRANASPLVGVYGQFPQYRARNARVNLIEDRINDCFERSMAGHTLPFDSADMRDMIAYMAWLGRGVPVGAAVPGQGIPRLASLEPDTTAGIRLYADVCARCHGADGDGTDLGPPVWGPRSYTDGAGMARVDMAAGYIRHNEPRDAPGTLTDQQAFDVAAYINSRPRPDFPGKVHDWPG